MQKNNYDRLAPFYDFVSHAVYGQALVKAQRSLLSFVKEGQNILIVGGGTGWILEELEKLNKKNIAVTYLEASDKMVDLARKKKVSFPVDFLCAYAEDVAHTTQYDVLMTPFFFDNFTEEKAVSLLENLDGSLKNGGSFLYVDFRITEQTSTFFNRTLLKTMYVFFKIFTHIETDKLVDMDAILEKKYTKLWSEFSFHNFVYAACYRKG